MAGDEQNKLTWSTYRTHLLVLQESLLGYGNRLDGFLGLFGQRNDSRVVFSANGAVEIDGLPLAKVYASISAYESSWVLLRFFHRFVRPFYPIKKRSALLLYAQSRLLLNELIALQAQPSIVAHNEYDARFRALSQQTRRLSAWSSLHDYSSSLQRFVLFWKNRPRSQIIPPTVTSEDTPLLSSQANHTYAKTPQPLRAVLPDNDALIETDSRIVVHPHAGKIAVSQHGASLLAADEKALRAAFTASTERLMGLLRHLDGLESDEDVAIAEAGLLNLYDDIDKEIRQMQKHYKALCLRYHPDKLGDGASHDAFTRLVSVYDAEFANFQEDADICKGLAQIKMQSVIMTRELKCLLELDRAISINLDILQAKQALESDKAEKNLQETKVELQETKSELQETKVEIAMLMAWYKAEQSRKGAEPEEKMPEPETKQKYNGPGMF